MLKIMSFFSMVTVIFFPKIVFAVETGVEIGGKKSFTGYWDYITTVFKFSVEVAVSLTTLMLIYAGFKYMTSQGNPTAISEAKDIVIGSLSGLAMLLLIYLILNVLNLPTGGS